MLETDLFAIVLQLCMSVQSTVNQEYSKPRSAALLSKYDFCCTLKVGGSH